MWISWRSIPRRGISKSEGLTVVKAQFIEGTSNSPVWEKPEPRIVNKRDHRSI